MRFSDRIGVTQQQLGLHLDVMPDTMRISLWNLILDLYSQDRDRYWSPVADHVAKNFRKYPADDLPFRSFELRDWLKEYLFKLPWFEVYNFLEFLVKAHVKLSKTYSSDNMLGHPVYDDQLERMLNTILERERSGYRFVAHVLSPITDSEELSAVSAATSMQGKGLDGARQHIRAALDLFSRRPNPDYRNAVKEAISAIESIAKQLGSDKGDGLAPALRALEHAAGIHGALRVAFEKLYGYTSDEQGIRHAMLDESNVEFEEAKYMIVACSAFANYLAAKADKAGLLK